MKFWLKKSFMKNIKIRLILYSCNKIVKDSKSNNINNNKILYFQSRAAIMRKKKKKMRALPWIISFIWKNMKLIWIALIIKSKIISIFSLFYATGMMKIKIIHLLLLLAIFHSRSAVSAINSWISTKIRCWRPLRTS